MSRFAYTDVAIVSRFADEIQRTLVAQGPVPTWDFPAGEMESRHRAVDMLRDLARRIQEAINDA